MSEQARSVTIRIWDGCTVRYVFDVGPTGSSSIGAAGGAGNSTRVDIELDPWAGLIVDHGAPFPAPMPIREGFDPGGHAREDSMQP